MKTANYYGNRRLKYPKAFENCCAKLFSAVIINDKGKIYPTSRGKRYRVEEYTTRANSNFGRFNDREYVQITLVTGKRIEVQTFTVFRRIEPVSPFNENIEIILLNLEIYEGNEYIRVCSNSGKGFIFGYVQTHGMGYYNRINYYPQDYRKLFLKSPLKYIEFGGGYFSDDELGRAYKYRDLLEVLKNLGNQKLYRDVIKGNVDMRSLTRNFIKKNKYLLKTYGYDMEDIRTHEALNGKIKLNPSNCHSISKGRLTVSSYEEIQKFQKEHSVNKNRLLKYLLKQERSLSYYKDYISTINELNTNDNSWMTLYPKDLRTAHNTASRLLETVERKLNEELMKKIHENTRSINFQEGKYMIKVAESLREIIDEGKALEHCVGNKRYLDGHLEKKLVILFLRDVNDPEKPLYTVEWRDGKVAQCYGFDDSEAPEEVHDFLKSWRSQIKKEITVSS